ncbi:uncharacterized protein EAE98_008253 [Botrytis deweyae]|uniref:Uncharacterized protein n=1 Tax=Botrytis deweyae TaxID=2478750 RepID=A0ABQ7IF66_9HELO|nr:uncharacterized protein EAE98_008253 [Botrytis deweyae]KAF7922042.1 hypothetical protein EAE98_008253 [Botrytis deweyae]
MSTTSSTNNLKVEPTDWARCRRLTDAIAVFPTSLPSSAIEEPKTHKSVATPVFETSWYSNANNLRGVDYGIAYQQKVM